MKILQISPQIPYPPVDGGKKGIFYMTKNLAILGHEIDFIALTTRLPKYDLSELKNYCNLHIIENDKSTNFKDAIVSLFSKVPYTFSRFHNKNVLKKIFSILDSDKIDLIHIDGTHCGYYGTMIKSRYDIPIVLRAHNYESLILKRFYKNSSNPLLKFFGFIEYTKAKYYEPNLYKIFDTVLPITQNDENFIKQSCPAINTVVIPAGVALDELSNYNIQEELNSILWVGALDWLPNVDSFWWFYKSIFPIIIDKNPKIKLYIVGSNPPNNILLLKHPNIQVLGFVDNITNIMSKVQVCVVPLRVGGGMRVKILEMLAFGKSVVTTSVGCEGINVMNGVHLSIADDETSFADKVIELINNDNLRKQFCINGKKKIADEYDWQVIVKIIETIYQSLIKG